MDARFEEFKNMNVSSYTFSDSLAFYGNDWNPNDLDLHLGVGKAEYSMEFIGICFSQAEMSHVILLRQL